MRRMASASGRGKISVYPFLIVIAFSVVAILGFQSFKDRRFYGDLIRDRDLELDRLEDHLKKEKRRTNDLQAKVTKLTTQRDSYGIEKDSLSRQLIDLGRTKSSFEEEKRKLEAVLEKKEIEIDDLQKMIKALENEKSELQSQLSEKAALAEKLSSEVVEGAAKNKSSEPLNSPSREEAALLNREFDDSFARSNNSAVEAGGEANKDEKLPQSEEKNLESSTKGEKDSKIESKTVDESELESDENVEAMNKEEDEVETRLDSVLDVNKTDFDDTAME